MANNCNPGTWEAEAGRFLSLRPAWSTECPESQDYTEKPCLKNPDRKRERERERERES